MAPLFLALAASAFFWLTGEVEDPMLSTITFLVAVAFAVWMVIAAVNMVFGSVAAVRRYFER